MNTRTSEELAAARQKSIDQLCALAARPDTTRAMLLHLSAEEKIDYNAPDSKTNLPAAYHAALSGSAEVLQFLIEELHVNLDAGNRDSNLFYYAQQNSSATVRTYVTDPVKKIWVRFNDQTSELHANILGNKIAETLKLLCENPDRLIEENQKEQSIFSMITPRNQEKMTAELVTLGLQFIHANKEKEAWANIAIHYHHLADYYKLSPAETEQAEECYDTSIHYYQKAIASHRSQNQSAQLSNLQIRLAACQIELAHMSLTRGFENYKKPELRKAITNYIIGESLLDDTIEAYQQLLGSFPESKQTIRQLESEKIDAMIGRACIHFEIGKAEQSTDNKLAEYQTSIKLTNACLALLKKIPPDEVSAADKQSFIDCYKQLATFHHDIGRAYQAIGCKAIKEAAFAKAIHTGFEKAIRHIETGLELHEKNQNADTTEYDSLLRLLGGNQYQNYLALLNDLEQRETKEKLGKVFLASYPSLLEALRVATRSYEKIANPTHSDQKNVELCGFASKKVEERYQLLTGRSSSKPSSASSLLNNSSILGTSPPAPLSLGMREPVSPDRLVKTTSNMFQPKSPSHLLLTPTAPQNVSASTNNPAATLTHTSPAP